METKRENFDEFGCEVSSGICLIYIARLGENNTKKGRKKRQKDPYSNFHVQLLLLVFSMIVLLKITYSSYVRGSMRCTGSGFEP